ncbi:hypothetical protein FBU30_006589 [Linnemannia zychae]|nr:hypothetical protein FBU30_006589 [Linnemannia zychae]
MNISKTNYQSLLNGASGDENAMILKNPDVSFRLQYWNIACIAASARDMLAYGKAKWTNDTYKFMPGWYSGIPTPYKVLPVLNIIPSEGKEIILSESIVIDQYLPKRFNLLGDNEWEEWVIKTHYKCNAAIELFLSATLPDFIASHEFLLKENGTNGHYVGDRVFNIHLVNVMDHFSQLPFGERFSAQFTKIELLGKVREKVEGNPEIATWRASEEWSKYAQGTIELFAGVRDVKEH